ncbi:ubiquitin C-terminal hydrolase 22 isoform X1 [Physcomitrium patens]|uniref:Ubiquitin carboxyl-terminal hydrolase n=1 Tax=Physcomitrium patens TaxID=3218 RepID=A0A7I4CRE6_PHYPA|nr:ubiquitin carboxyl-terminal hydrolase 37-like isoform X1 [Physcomitrium patens]|eukprot:XP_024363352.1 ubiquitin carboxyl-terminal hydrolase 37-like isoform X1 [Physcomitrella patens]
MSLVVNMQQRRTVADGRQNQDPNTIVFSVSPAKRRTSKRLQISLEKSSQDDPNNSKNTAGRGGQMVLSALQKKQPTQQKITLEISRPAVVTPELEGGKRSIFDIRKRQLDEDESRAPLSVLDASKHDGVDNDWTTASPAKPTSKGGTHVYRKRSKTGTTPPTPSLRSFGRRQVTKEASPPPLPPPAFAPKSLSVGDKDNSESQALMPTGEQVAVMDILQPVRRQLLSPPKAREESDLYGSSATTNNMDVVTSYALLGDSETQVLGFENQIFSFIPTSPRRMHGLMNLGNTCYMNVIIQCLYNTSSFVDGMERFFGLHVKQNHSEGSEPFSYQDAESVHAALLKVFRDLKQAGRYEYVNPSVVKHAFAKHQSSFWGCIQQDAHEFFCSLIDRVQEEVSSELKRQFPIDANQPKLDTVCPTTQNFSCSVRNSLTCTGCGKVSSLEETYRDFCLALPEDERTHASKNCSLESLLNLYFQEITMSRKCEDCGVEVTKAKAQFLKLPHVLVLQLKRLHMDCDVPCTKVTAPVKFTPRLDVGPWCAPDKQKFWSPVSDDVQNFERKESVASPCSTQNGLGIVSQGNIDCESQELHAPLRTNADVGTNYRLYGVVNHLGFTASGGHFFADTYDPEGDRWLRCDDSFVTDVSEDSVLANVREAYMFFYVHEPVSSIS